MIPGLIRSSSSNLSAAKTGSQPCLYRFLLTVLGSEQRMLGQHEAVRRFSVGSWQQQPAEEEQCNATGLNLSVMPPHIILIRHGETAGLESLQEELQVPNHRVPLSAAGVQESIQAGQAIQQLLTGPDSSIQQQQHDSRVFLYTSPFLRCIQTAQHITRALRDNQLTGFREEVQLREQDWGNFQRPGDQARNYEQRLKYGRFFYRFPDGESAADVYDRMTMFQDHFVRDIACQRFAGNTSVVLVTHGLALRLFLMRWLHWSVDDFLQVHNPPTAQPIVLSRRELQPCSNTTTSSNSSSNSSVRVGPESVKSCYGLTGDSLQRLRGVSPEMSTGHDCSSKQQLLAWRPYLKQVPPPPAMDPSHEQALHALMEVGYGSGSGSVP